MFFVARFISIYFGLLYFWGVLLKMLVAEWDSYHNLSCRRKSLLYQLPACQHNFVAIPALSRITALAMSVIQVISTVPSELCVFLCVLVCCGLITLDYWELICSGALCMLCVYTCRPQITLEFSVWGLPTASSSLIIVVHLLVICAAIRLYRQLQQSTLSLKKPEKQVTHYTNLIHLWNLYANLFCYILTPMAVSISLLI